MYDRSNQRYRVKYQDCTKEEINANEARRVSVCIDPFHLTTFHIYLIHIITIHIY